MISNEPGRAARLTVIVQGAEILCAGQSRLLNPSVEENLVELFGEMQPRPQFLERRTRGIRSSFTMGMRTEAIAHSVCR